MRNATRFVLLLMLALLMGVAAAQPAEESPVLRLATVMPAETEVYFSLRIDEGYLDTLDGLIGRLGAFAQEVEPSLEVPTLRQILVQALRADPDGLDAVLAWAGDSLALGVDLNSSGELSGALIAIEVADRAAAEAYLVENFGGIGTAETRGSVTLYASDSSTLIVSDSLLIITDQNVDAVISGDYARLTADAAFTTAVANLPADSYNILAYVSASALRPQGAEMIAPVVIGATILDGATLTLDLSLGAGLLGGQRPQLINPDFARFIPRDANAVIHASDLASLVNRVLAQAEIGGEMSRTDLDSAFAVLGITLDDFLALTKGDYALASRVDLVGLLQAAVENNSSSMLGLFQLALIIETVNQAKADALAEGISDALRLVVAQADGQASLDTEQVGTLMPRVLSLDIPGFGSLRLAAAANADVFFLGTLGAALQTFGNNGGLAANPIYVESQRYWLPDPIAVWYADGEGIVSVVGVGAVGGLALLGPAIGNVFEDIQQQFNAGASAAAPAPTRVQDADQIRLLARVLNRLSTLIRHATITTSLSGDGSALLLRATLTLGE